MSETTGEVQGAPFISEPAGSFAEDSLTKGTSSALSDVEPFSFTRRLMRAGAAGISTYGETDPESGRQLTDPDEKLPVDALQQKYSIPGKLTFDTPLPDEVARSMYQNKIGELRREAAAERRPSGFVAGATSMGVHALADSLDPLFIGSMFIPGIPEVDLGASVAGRIGARALSGGASGAAMMAPLAAMNYGLGRQEQSDYTAYQAMADIAVGAGLGAALHVGGGALGDWLTDRVLKSKAGQLIAESPDQRETTLRTVASQVLQDQPTDASIMFPDHVLTETEPGGWGAFPRGETVSGETVGEPPAHITEPPTPGVPTPRAVPFEPENEPEGLTSFLVRHGGLKDEGGDVRSMIGGARYRPGLINSNGMGHDDAALLAWENGFFPDHAEQRPDINTFLEALDNDVKGHSPRYSEANRAAIDAYQNALASNHEILRLSDETGIPTQNITRAQFFDQVHSTLTPEDFDARVGTVQQAREDAYHQAEELAREWVAYHGTPHDFDRFDTGKIGTGEGAQAYGHGLYFAENEGVATSYRNQLSRANRDEDFVFDGKAYHGDELEHFDGDHGLGAGQAIDRMIGSGFKQDMARGQLENDVRRAGDWEPLITDESIREDLANFAFPESDEPHAKIMARITPAQIAERRAGFLRQAAEERERAQRALEWFDQHKDRITAPERSEGHLYTVRIKAKPEEVLDWDKSLSQQPEMLDRLEALAKDRLGYDRHQTASLTGNELYSALVSAEGHRARMSGGTSDGAASDASAVLHDLGVKGLRYLDRTSRDLHVAQIPDAMHEGGRWVVYKLDRDGGGERVSETTHATRAEAEKEAGHTSNVVVFNHDDVEITHKNGEPVEPHAPSETEAREISETHGQEAHGGFDAETFYGKDQNRSLEDLERERGQEDAATAARQRQSGDEPAGSAAAHQGGVQEGGGPGGRGAGSPGREDAGTGEAGGGSDAGADTTRGIAANDALRRASGERPANPNESAADAAVKETPKDALRRAEQEVADHEEFFRRGEAEGGFGDLTREVQAELESIQGLDQEAKDVGEGAMQAAACVARGMRGGVT